MTWDFIRLFLGEFDILLIIGVLTRPQRDPGVSRDPGIGLKSRSRDYWKLNPGIFPDLENDVFEDHYWVSDNIRVFWGPPEPFKVLKIFTLKVDSTNSRVSMEHVDYRSVQL